MTTYLALLRGVNVGGHRKVAMSDLREMMCALGIPGAQTLLQSGNLVFRAARRGCDSVEAWLEAETVARLALQTRFFVRTAREWHQIVSGNPFTDQARRDPAHLVVFLLKRAPLAADVAALQRAIVGPETAKVSGTCAYAVYPEDIGHSKLTASVVERTLGTPVTARNWNTVRKLEALAATVGL